MAHAAVCRKAAVQREQAGGHAGEHEGAAPASYWIKCLQTAAEQALAEGAQGTLRFTTQRPVSTAAGTPTP